MYNVRKQNGADVHLRLPDVIASELGLAQSAAASEWQKILQAWM
jgi:hypothetical protein